MMSVHCSKRFPCPRDAPLWCQLTTSGMTVMAVTQTTLTLSQTNTRAVSPPSTEQGHVTMNMSNATMNPMSEVDITMTAVTARKRSLSCTDARITTPRNARVKGHEITPGALTSTCAGSGASNTKIVIVITTQVRVGSDSVMINSAPICSERNAAITHHITLWTMCDVTRIDPWLEGNTFCDDWRFCPLNPKVVVMINSESIRFNQCCVNKTMLCWFVELKTHSHDNMWV